MNSDTSSDFNFNAVNENINAIKKESSETDYYLNLIANTNKVVEEELADSSSLDLEESEKNDSFKNINKDSPISSTSKPQFETININSDKRPSSRHSSRRSTEEYSNHMDFVENHKVSTESENNNSFKNSPVSKEPKYVTQQNTRMKKIELLRKLCELKSKGYKLSKEYDFNSSIEEMEYEYDLLKSFADKRNGVKLYKNIILNACNVIEFLNDKYDPFNFQLSGWSKHMDIEVDSYEDVLEELYEKYRGRGKSMPPEIKLLLLILASASAFHFSKSFENTIPGVSQMHKNNPDFIPNLINGKKKQNQYMSEQEMNIERQRQELREQERKLKEQMRQNNVRINSQFNPPQQTVQPQVVSAPQFQTPQMADPMSAYTSKPQYQSTFASVSGGPPSGNIKSNDPRDKEPMIKKNENVADILKRLHSNNATEEESSVNNDRIISDATETLSETTSARRRRKKPMMVIT